MLPVKDILAIKPYIPEPPVLVIDETVIRNTHDAGPVCGCEEKYQVIQDYKPFIPGGIHPYNRREIPDGDRLEVAWINIRIGTEDFNVEKPIARHICELPNDYKPKKEDEDDLMFLRLPHYTKAYVKEKCLEYMTER